MDGILFLGEATHHENAGIGVAGADMSQDVDATAIRHIDVEDDEVPLTVAQLLQRLLAAARLGDRVDRTVLLQVVPEPGPHHRVIVRNEYAWHSASFGLCQDRVQPSVAARLSAPLKASQYAVP